MNTNFMLPSVVLVLAAGLVGACASGGQGATVRGGGAVNVRFEHPEQFSDLKRTYSDLGSDSGYLNQLRQHIQRSAASRIPEGHTLDLTITDVDMAGDFEPQRGGNFTDVRIVKSIYPPRIRLTYRLTGPGGTVVSEGQRSLRDAGWDWTISGVDQDDPLRHEKRLIDDFLNEIGRSR